MPTSAEHVIALDPGERTGWASATMARDQFQLTGLGVQPRQKMAMILANRQGINFHAHRWHPKEFDRIVWESWSPRPDKATGKMDWIKGDRLLSARHIGHFELVAWLTNTPTWEFGPDRKEAFQMTMAPQLVEVQRGQSEQHSKDAMMHLWGWFMKHWWTGDKTPEECVVSA